MLPAFLYLSIYLCASTIRLSPHLSKTRQPTVLARIQSQLIFIPSYFYRTVVYTLHESRETRYHIRVYVGTLHTDTDSQYFTATLWMDPSHPWDPHKVSMDLTSASHPLTRDLSLSPLTPSQPCAEIHPQDPTKGLQQGACHSERYRPRVS